MSRASMNQFSKNCFFNELLTDPEYISLKTFKKQVKVNYYRSHTKKIVKLN